MTNKKVVPKKVEGKKYFVVVASIKNEVSVLNCYDDEEDAAIAAVEAIAGKKDAAAWVETVLVKDPIPPVVAVVIGVKENA
jgi:hypothetical protein